jgi:hypothetical protein
MTKNLKPLKPLFVLMSVRRVQWCAMTALNAKMVTEHLGLTTTHAPPPSEQGGTHDLVDVPDRHCSHCRLRVGVLEEQEMTIPPELQDRLIEVLRIAHDNALEAHQDAQARYKGYKQHRIDALGAEAVETGTVLMEILKARNT